MKKILEYTIAQSSSGKAGDTIDNINEIIKEGWQPFGGVSLDECGILCQAMVKYEEDPTKPEFIGTGGKPQPSVNLTMSDARKMEIPNLEGNTKIPFVKESTFHDDLDDLETENKKPSIIDQIDAFFKEPINGEEEEKEYFIGYMSYKNGEPFTNDKCMYFIEDSMEEVSRRKGDKIVRVKVTIEKIMDEL